MDVDLIAHTFLTGQAWHVFQELGFAQDPASQDAEDLIEFAGRLCYESYHKPNEKTRSNADYLANVALQKHFSVFEHASATFLIRGVSRALTHELVRHRHFSFSQVSQRYVDSSEREFVDHPVLGDLLVGYSLGAQAARDVVTKSSQAYRLLVDEMVSSGLSRKEARGAARLVLPEGTTTDIVVTGNFRSWLEFIDKRATKFADAEIRELAEEILKQLQETFPNAFQDAVAQPEESRPEPVSIQKVAVEQADLEPTAVNYYAIIQEEIRRAMQEMFK